ncbi:uncharacterized protein EI90DRAFT_3032312 [Cantharellus anzutake]|uniref:uncharacterized protein n=1 Tax=Cantharellus anzutake TaxID=1750568 RepID=UPI0019059102|nr:uncharacterized protein EI90DRAFT_3032312 [Cantharellus anzutake]KAF8342161.1 hypothetical protein EI90DRAFT_3032312 [Cantharellus anzutake]
MHACIHARMRRSNSSSCQMASLRGRVKYRGHRTSMAIQEKQVLFFFSPSYV